MRRNSVVGSFIVIALIGCERERFEVLMQRLPDGRVRRAITIWTENEDKVVATSDTVLARYRAIYGEPLVRDAEKYTFATIINTDWPKDIRGDGAENHGSFSVLSSPMGKSAVYLERLPGMTSPRDLVRNQQQLADLTVRALAAYVQQQPGLVRQCQPLVRFLDSELRADLENVALNSWLGHVGGAKDDQVLLPTFSYLLEHGYADVGDVCALAEYDTQILLRRALRKIAAVLGTSVDALPPELARLKDPKALRVALQQGLAAIGSSDEELAALMGGSLAGSGSSGDISGIVTWRFEEKPVTTNGKRDELAGELRWTARGTAASELPQVLLAVWAQPDEAFQQAHFGSVILSEHLPAFNAWFNSLSPAESARWEEFVATLHPDSDLDERLENFRFKPAPPQAENQEQQPQPDHAEFATHLLRDGLKSSNN
ncbi:MAG TPA: hypothetical protein VGM03_13025 [Phycisphaerae bacterium]